MEHVRIRLEISGRVQGVGFRHHTRHEALKLGLKGWVRNLPDGRVEALLEGEPAEVSQMIAWCRRGPSGARIDALEEFVEEPTGEFDSFAVRWSC